MEDNTFKAAQHIAGYLSTGTRRAFAADDTTKQAGADDHDKKVKHAVHKALKTAHKHAFSSDTRSLDEAKAKHSAFVAFSEPDDDDDDKSSK